MSTRLSQTNAQRTQFAAYVLTFAAVVFAIERIMLLVSSRPAFEAENADFTQSSTLFERVSLASTNTEFFALFLVAAAFLLMLDSEEEPWIMRVSIFTVFGISAALFLLQVVGLLWKLTDEDSTRSLNEVLTVFTSHVPSMLLTLAALFMTWSFVSTRANTHELAE